MSYQDFVEMARANKAAKKANDLNATMQRAGALLQTVVDNMTTKAAAERQAEQEARPSTPCQRALRQIVMSRKNASDTRTTIDRIRDLLDAKVASDPALRAMRTLGEARARKEALEVKQQQARNVTMETPRHPAPAPEKPLEGQENKDEGRAVTFSDGRTVNFPANGTTPVKSAADRAKEIMAACKKASNNRLAGK